MVRIFLKNGNYFDVDVLGHDELVDCSNFNGTKYFIKKEIIKENTFSIDDININKLIIPRDKVEFIVEFEEYKR